MTTTRRWLGERKRRVSHSEYWLGCKGCLRNRIIPALTRNTPVMMRDGLTGPLTTLLKRRNMILLVA